MKTVTKYFPNYDGRTARIVVEGRTTQISLWDNEEIVHAQTYTNDTLMNRSGELCMMFREDENGSTAWSTVNAQTMNLIQSFLYSTRRAN